MTTPLGVFQRDNQDYSRFRAPVMLVILTVLLLGGCSHRVLTFFFTGVPEPGQRQEVAVTTVETAHDDVEDDSQPKYSIAAQNFYAHGPWGSQRCDSCHLSNTGRKYNTITMAAPSMVRLGYEDDELCTGCHADERFVGGNQDNWVHGPVANRQCLTCHNPHRSERRYMLYASSNIELCTGCHKPDDLRHTQQHTEQPETECTGCHNAHAGASPMLLKTAVQQ